QAESLQSGERLGLDWRKARNGGLIQHAVAHNTQASGALRNKHVSIRKKGEAPRMRESFCDDGYANLVLLPRVEDEWPIAEWRNGYSRARPLSPLLRISGNDDEDNHNSQSQPTFHNVLPGDRHIVLL